MERVLLNSNIGGKYAFPTNTWSKPTTKIQKPAIKLTNNKNKSNPNHHKRDKSVENSKRQTKHTLVGSTLPTSHNLTIRPRRRRDVRRFGTLRALDYDFFSRNDLSLGAAADTHQAAIYSIPDVLTRFFAVVAVEMTGAPAAALPRVTEDELPLLRAELVLISRMCWPLGKKQIYRKKV